jgi:3-hydroxy acid dehydrogenase / malonic semialdehyde reductase
VCVCVCVCFWRACADWALFYSGCDPLTPEDIAESIVFAASRKENVVIADQLIFPNHQAAATIMHRRT